MLSARRQRLALREYESIFTTRRWAEGVHLLLISPAIAFLHLLSGYRGLPGYGYDYGYGYTLVLCNDRFATWRPKGESSGSSAALSHSAMSKGLAPGVRRWPAPASRGWACGRSTSASVRVYLPAFHEPLPVSSSSVPAGTVKPSLNCHVNWRVTLHTRLILHSPIHAIRLSPTQASKGLPRSHTLRSSVARHTVLMHNYVL